MKKILLGLTILVSSVAMSQETAKSKYTFGFGVNFIDNSGTFENKFFETGNWNAIPFVSAFTVQRKMTENFSLSGQFLLNEFDKNNIHNGMMITKDATYASINLNALYTFDSHIVDVKWFDASVIAGVGALWVDGTPNQTFNTGLALDFWLSENVALRLETQGRFAFEDTKVANNHIVHSISFIVPFK
ncbi:MAG: hypothetical protein MUE72_05965 [Chitinophagaceae bacterium]|nr:hypothetical protein [Chitinophagaceae bacterium]